MNKCLECDIKHQIFISYCSKNKQIVHRIADELENLKYQVWIDRQQLPNIHLYSEIAKGGIINILK
jgi:hypothetical protein